MESRIEQFSVRKMAIAVSLALPAIAVQAEAPTTELAPVVVTASAAELAIKDAPASMSVITAEEIKKLPAADLNEVLRRVPGLSQGTSPDGGTSIQIRGLPQQYTMILIDGRRTGSSSETFDRYTRNELNWIPVEMIERIEVVRGPMSSLYGSDAMGGVINIITKKTGTKWGGTVSAGAEYNPDSIRGSDYNGGFSIGGPLAENLRLRINGQQTYRQADSGLPDGTTAFRWGGGREGTRIQSYGANLDWDISDKHRLSLDYQHGQWRTLSAPEGDTSNPGGFTAAAFTRGPALMERDAIGLNYSGKHAIGTSKVSLQHIEYKNDTTAPLIRNGQLVERIPANPRDPYETYRTNAVAKDLILDGSLSMPLTWGFEQLLTVGAQWQKNELDNPNSVGSLPNTDGQVGLSYKKTNAYALFAEDQIYLRDNLNLTLGLRADHHDDFGSQLSPRAYLVYHPDTEWTIRGGYSEGFKAPSLRQSNPNFVSQSRGAGCLPGATAGTGCYTRGNANLKPETTENWEIGFAWERQSWQAGMSFFNTDFKNKLHQRGLGYLPGSTVYWQESINIASAVTRGIEGNLRIPLIEKSSLSALQSLTWSTNVTHMLKAENKGTGEPLTSVPEWSATSSLDWQVTNDLGVTFLAEFIGKQVNLDWRVANNANSFGDQRIQNSYTIYDLGLHYQISKQLRLNTGIKNLFDHDASGNSDAGNNFYIPGRRYFATLTASF